LIFFDLFQTVNADRVVAPNRSPGHSLASERSSELPAGLTDAEVTEWRLIRRFRNAQI